MLRKRKTFTVLFSVTLCIIAALFILSVIKTRQYNAAVHEDSFTGENLFRVDDDRDKDLSVRAETRSSTWTKLFDINNEGLTEHNYQAYTYDFYISNNTKDEISDYKFKLTFDREAFLFLAWNGSLEIHQFTDDGELVNVVPDLRDFHPENHNLNLSTFDGEVLVHMLPGDYLIYLPSSSENAMEVPVEPYEGVVPGMIIYIPIGENIDNSVLTIDYTFHRQLKSEPIFKASLIALGVWLLVLVIFIITEAQYLKYKQQHDHDNEIIKESIETFTGFIDAKDPYTNGHSNRVAQYTRMIAEEMGYEGEELNRIYYVALLHDCGKIGVPDNILGKPGRLTDEEFEIIKSHTTHGSEILSHFKSLPNVNEGARFHHERYDGRGYPEGLKGENIPLIARMICVADSFDAMNSNRVYRKKLTTEDIIKEIEKNKGTQFDPKIADIFLKIIKSGKVDKLEKDDE